MTHRHLAGVLESSWPGSTRHPRPADERGAGRPGMTRDGHALLRCRPARCNFARDASYEPCGGANNRASRRNRDESSATSPGSSAPMPAIRRPRNRTRSIATTSARARPASRSPSICRPRPATTAIIRSPRARSARSACRSRISATCARCSSGIPARRHEHLDDHQRDGGLAARALCRARRRAGRAARQARRARRRTTSSRNISRAAPTCFRRRPPCG